MTDEKNIVEFDFNANLSTVPTVESNLEDLRTFVAQVKEAYVAHDVDAGNVIAAKKDLAAFRKVQSAIDGKVKSIKKELMAPYNEYKAKVDEICGELDAIESELAGRIKAEEQRQEEAKRQAICDLLGTINEELKPSVVSALDGYWRDDWTNKGTSLKKVEESYRRVASEAEATLAAINGNPHEAQLLAVFKTTHCYAHVSLKISEFEREDRRLAELKAQQEAERKAREAEIARESERPTFTDPQPEPAPVVTAPEVQETPVVIADFHVVGTIEEIKALVAVARNYGMGFKRFTPVAKATEEDIAENGYRRK